MELAPGIVVIQKMDERVTRYVHAPVLFLLILRAFLAKFSKKAERTIRT